MIYHCEYCGSVMDLAYYDDRGGFGLVECFNSDCVGYELGEMRDILSGWLRMDWAGIADGDAFEHEGQAILHFWGAEDDSFEYELDWADVQDVNYFMRQIDSVGKREAK